MALIQTTPEQFEEFKRVARIWLEKFGLKFWRVCFNHVELRPHWGAQTAWSLDGRIATLSYNQEIDTADVIPCPARSAFHEVCELLMADTSEELHRFCSDERVGDLNHRIIRILENTVFEPWYAEEQAREKAEAQEKFFRDLFNGDPDLVRVGRVLSPEAEQALASEDPVVKETIYLNPEMSEQPVDVHDDGTPLHIGATEIAERMLEEQGRDHAD